MPVCSKCGKVLSSNGFCHECLCYRSSWSTPSFNKWCEVCGKSFTDRKSYQEHIEQHPQCKICSEHFKSEDDLKKHMKVHECPICHEHHHPSHIPIAHPLCNICEQRFLNEEVLEEHIKQHPQCEFCGKRFNSKVDLKTHIDANHKCDICNGFFSNVPDHLKNTHPYCNLCNKYFLDNAHYKAHISTHPQCDFCKLRFKSKKSLNEHNRAFHKCIRCGKLFELNEERVQHMRDLHSDDHFVELMLSKNFFNYTEKDLKKIIAFELATNNVELVERTG